MTKNNSGIVIVAYKDGKILERFKFRDFEKQYIRLHIDRATKLGTRELLKKKINTPENKLLVLIDIKDFGLINESYGEDFGNAILIQLSKKIQDRFQEFEIYKIEGDIFGLLLRSHIKYFYTPKEMKNKIDLFFLKPFTIHSKKIDLFFTAAYVQGKNDLLNKAEMTIREAKQNSKDFLAYSNNFANKRREKHEEHKIMSSKVIEAIKKNRIYPVFQPIYSNITNKIEKYEALARLRTLDNEELSPILFLEIAKKTNLYSEITRSMIKKSLEEFNDNNYGLSLNLSLQDLTDINTVEFILREVKKFRAPERLFFEILEDESVALLETSDCCKDGHEKNQIANRFFDGVKELGCNIAIDDFGTGYSNFINILKLKPKIIKIDGSLTSQLEEDEVKIIVELIVSYAQKVGCEIVAEYVSDEKTQNMIRDMNITYSQGYFIGKPSADIRQSVSA